MGQQHPRARLADALQGLDGDLEVSNVEDRQLELDVACNENFSKKQSLMNSAPKKDVLLLMGTRGACLRMKFARWRSWRTVRTLMMIDACPLS